MEYLQINLESLRSLVLFAHITAAIFAIVFYRKYSGTFLKYFVWFIWYDLANEFSAPFYSEYISYNNVVLYNIYKIVEFSFYLLLYKNLVQNFKYKNSIKAFFIIYLTSVIVNCFFQDFLTEVFTNNYFVGAVFILISIILYFSEILNSDKIVQINRTFSFWISIGAFLFYLTSIPFKLMINYNMESSSIPYIYASNYAVVFIFYIILITGLFWSRKE